MSLRPRKPWSKVMLHRHLLNLLARPMVTLKYGEKRNGYAADCVFDDKFPPAYVRIVVDANKNDTVWFVIHELLHVVCCEIVLGKFDQTLEEAFMLGLDNYMWDFVKSSPRRLRKWERLIQKKLAENPAEPPIPLAAQVDRSYLKES